MLSFTARSQKAALELPERVELAGEPRVNIAITWLENIGWLAGRGYTVLSVQIPARVADGKTGPVEGEYVAVLRESHKYLPRTGDWGAADVDCLTVSAGDEPDLVTGLERGQGKATFTSAT